MEVTYKRLEATTMVCNTDPLAYLPALLEWELDGERTPIQTSPSDEVMDEATPMLLRKQAA